jgi:hypothetical protein
MAGTPIGGFSVVRARRSPERCAGVLIVSDQSSSRGVGDPQKSMITYRAALAASTLAVSFIK